MLTKDDVKQLRFDSEQQANEVLNALYNSSSSPTHDIFKVPPIIDTPPQFDDEGNITVEATYVEGAHYDIIDRNGLPDALTEYLATPSPNTPSHEVAGL